VTHARRLGANNGNVVAHPEFIQYPEGNRKNHFQGIQRRGKYLFVSAGVAPRSRNSPGSRLIVVEMGSRSTKKSWSWPSYQPEQSPYDFRYPDPKDRIVKVMTIDVNMWHAGGLQLMGTTLAVPIHGKLPRADRASSQVRFYNIRSNTKPKEIRALRIDDRPTKKANAVGLTTLPGGRKAAVVWDDKTLDFYLTTSATSTTWQRISRVSGESIPKFLQNKYTQYQCLNLIRDTISGELFLVCFRNSSPLSPIIEGRNLADIYRVALDPQNPPTDANAAQTIRKVKGLHFKGDDSYCSFNAGGGLYITRSGHIFVYGTPHWLHNDNARYNFIEFTPEPV
jgi:hypothetical protein